MLPAAELLTTILIPNRTGTKIMMGYVLDPNSDREWARLNNAFIILCFCHDI
jgi:hypothetical protein